MSAKLIKFIAIILSILLIVANCVDCRQSTSAEEYFNVSLRRLNFSLLFNFLLLYC